MKSGSHWTKSAATSIQYILYSKAYMLSLDHCMERECNLFVLQLLLVGIFLFERMMGDKSIIYALWKEISGVQKAPLLPQKKKKKKRNKQRKNPLYVVWISVALIYIYVCVCDVKLYMSDKRKCNIYHSVNVMWKYWHKFKIWIAQKPKKTKQNKSNIRNTYCMLQKTISHSVFLNLNHSINQQTSSLH